MNSRNHPLPDVEALQEGIATVFKSTEYADRRFHVDRKPNAYSSTFPSEIVTCRFSHGEQLRLLLKYQAGRDEGRASYRRSLSYEAATYRRIVSNVSLTAPRFFGSYHEPRRKNTWLVIEFVERGTRVSTSKAPASSMGRAAKWVGGFHAQAAETMEGGEPPFLVKYDSCYYRRWARQTAQVARKTPRRLWLKKLCDNFESVIQILTTSPHTVIHGEYYPENILVRRNGVFPVDWQSAAIAPGEIDLAVLTSGGWEPEIVLRCEREYRRARWPEGVPQEFPKRLAAARTYWPMMFLCQFGFNREHANFLRDLRAAGEELGLI